MRFLCSTSAKVQKSFPMEIKFDQDNMYDIEFLKGGYNHQGNLLFFHFWQLKGKMK